MSKLLLKEKDKKLLIPEELQSLDKNELISKILKLEAHNVQLRNVISKNLAVDVNTESKNKKFNFANRHYRRVLLRIMYFGWDYRGLAVQEVTSQTIEHHLFNALIKACLIEKRENSNYHRCGRTDKGVSSFGQVISISLRSVFPPQEQQLPSSIASEIPYCKILNRLLPKDIRAVAWMPIPDDRPEYSSRFDCKKRQYKYYFPRSSLDIDAMRAACAHIVGSHDFRHLCKMDVGNGVTQFHREIFRAEVLPVHEESDTPTTMYYLLIEGNAFLWHQIRCIMGVLLLIGQGKEEPSIFLELLDVEKNPRKPQYNMALDLPLNLFHCSYDLDDNGWVFSENELKVVIEHLQNEWTVQNIKSTMIKDCLQELESEYAKLRRREEKQDVDDDMITEYAECLTTGVKTKKYKPLLKRNTCSTLEERIEHYTKKRKIEEGSEKNTVL